MTRTESTQRTQAVYLVRTLGFPRQFHTLPLLNRASNGTRLRRIMRRFGRIWVTEPDIDEHSFVPEFEICILVVDGGVRGPHPGPAVL